MAKEKQTKEEVNYRTGSATKQCRMCTMFRRPYSCTDVKGTILPSGVCDIFDRKK